MKAEIAYTTVAAMNSISHSLKTRYNYFHIIAP